MGPGYKSGRGSSSEPVCEGQTVHEGPPVGSSSSGGLEK